jgi:hypothetical protein
MAIVICANIEPMAAISGPMNLQSLVTIVVVGALRQTHGTDGVLGLKVHDEPGVMADTVARMPMLVGAAIDVAEPAPP